jgi:signal transduction histidine kinase
MAGVRRVASLTRRFLLEPSRVDWLLAGSFMLAAELEVLIRRPQFAWQQELSAIAAVPLFGLAWRRRKPLVPLVLLTSSAVASVAAGARTPMVIPGVALLLATYSLGAYASNLGLGVGALLPTAMAGGIDLLLPRPPVPVLSGLVWYLIFVTRAPVFMGRLVRSRSLLIGRLVRQRTALVAERDARGRQAVTAERQRISQQLRGVVIHSVDSLIADVAIAEADPGAVGVAAVLRIESVARKALREMRPLVGQLHQHDAEKPQAPAGAPAATIRFEAGSGPSPALARRLHAVLLRAPWPVILAGVVLVGFEAEIQGLGLSHTRSFLIDASLVGIAAPIAWSRTRPLAAAAISLIALCATSRLLIPIPISGSFVVLAVYLPFSVAAFSHRRMALIGLAACALGVVGAFGLHAPPALVDGAGAWVAGRLLADRTRLARELEAINRNLADERDLRAYELVLEERLRVARELHDVIGHTLTVVVLQAGAARRNWVADRARAKRALASLGTVAREGLIELLASLDTVDDSSAAALAGLMFQDVEALIEQARSAGVRVAFVSEEIPAIVNPRLELTTYRVVQEALTNVMKHAPRSHAQVRIRLATGSLHVEVVNSGPLRNGPRSATRLGHGLPGMAQRVEASGGELRWGRDSSGGFGVRARLPIEELA